MTKIVAFIVSGPTGNYDARIPVEENKDKAYKKACRIAADEPNNAIGIELENGEVTFEW
jgi:hypothetical protein